MANGNRWVGAVPARVCALLLVLTCMSVAPKPATGKSSGTTGAAFLKIPVGPRAAAMGSAYTAVTEGPYALHYNPAAVGLADDWKMSAMHQTQFGEIRFDYFGLSAPAFKDKSGWGVSFIRQAIDDYDRTELDDGVKFVNADMALTMAYAHRIFKPLTLGVSGKLIRQNLSKYEANGWAVDIGGHLQVNPRLSLGASALHMGPKIKFIAVGDPLPMTFRFGTALRLLPRGNLLATFDYWFPKYDVDGVGIGVEYRPNRFVAVRGGYELGTTFTGFNAASLGMTFDFENFGIEYAFVPREKLGDVHRAGLNVTFGGKKPEVIAAKPKRPTQRRETVRRPSETPERPAPAASRPAEPRRAEEPAPYVERPQRTEPVLADEPRASQAQSRTSDMMSLRKSAAPAEEASLPPTASAAGVTTAPERPMTTQAKIPSAPPVVPARRAPEEYPADVQLAPPKERRPYYESVITDQSLEPAVSRPAASAATSAPVRSVTAESREAIAQEKISLSSSLMKEKRYEEASAIVRSALRDDPRNVPLLYLLSECLYRLGDYDQAMEAVNNALAVIHGGRNP